MKSYVTYGQAEGELEERCEVGTKPRERGPTHLGWSQAQEGVEAVTLKVTPHHRGVSKRLCGGDASERLCGGLSIVPMPVSHWNALQEIKLHGKMCLSPNGWLGDLCTLPV